MKRKALLIGINDYVDGQLKYAEEDALELGSVLSERFEFQTHLLLGKDATRAAILDAVSSSEDPNTPAGLHGDDQFLLFFAGHGQLLEHGFALLPYDAGPLQSDRAITMQELGDVLEKGLTCRHCMCILDACRSVGVGGGRGGATLDSVAARDIERVSRSSKEKIVEVLFGCEEGQQCWEDASLEHGVLSHHLIQVLRHAEPSRRMTFTDLGDRTGELMLGWSHADGPEVAQRAYLYRPAIRRTTRLSPPDRFVNSIGINLVFVGGGAFEMGCPPDEPGHQHEEDPVHKVTLSDFYLGAHPVTVGQFDQFMKAKGVPVPRCFQNAGEMSIRNTAWSNQTLHPDRAVVMVDWEGAVAFCQWLSSRGEGTYKLPTEAQWEYACRAGTTTPFACGRTLQPEAADFGEQVANPTNIGTCSPNAWGFYDMHGNVEEWCDDNFDPGFYAKPASHRPDPVNRDEPDQAAVLSYFSISPDLEDPTKLYTLMQMAQKWRVLRGGSCCSSATRCRSASRRGDGFDLVSESVGFRVAWRPA